MQMLDASCVAGIVTADGKPVATAEVLSAGVAASQGLLLLQGELAKYVTSNATDIKDVLTSINSIVTKITTVLTALDSALSSANTATIALIVAENAQLLVKKELLK